MRKILIMPAALMGIIAVATMFAPHAGAEPGGGFVKPKERDKCPVCGMFVSKYPDWTAEIVFADGSYAVFDGAKDLFRYYLGLPDSGPGRKRRDVASLLVTDYYSLLPVDGRQAFFVLGSDVYGPMGKDLVPFQKENPAREFLADHKGTAILRFPDVTQAVLKELD